MNETGETEGREAIQARAAAQSPFKERWKERQALSGGDGAAIMVPGVDQSRFMAGLIELYKTVLNEPAPDRMLELIEEIRKNESKSND